MSSETEHETAEQRRLRECRQSASPVAPWRLWGPYLADRSWGTVREDYSGDANAWSYFPHDQARSRAYRWVEDGIGGISDRYQLLCLGFGFWNGVDPILKERFFGLDAWEGNHAEDVKECYYYLDSTPTHSYMRMLYKYPQRSFPYTELIEKNRRRNGADPEFELIDTGIFSEGRYFDIELEYAKNEPDDLLIRALVTNRGPDSAPFHLLAQLWFRNTWGWNPGQPRPVITSGKRSRAACLEDDASAAPLNHLPFPYDLGKRYLYGDSSAVALFTENETDHETLFGTPNAGAFVKNAFHRHIIGGEDCVNPQQRGTKAALYFKEQLIEPGETVEYRFRLTPRIAVDPFAKFGEVFDVRRAEADEFYSALHPPDSKPEEKRVQRQAWAGLLWSKQFYHFNVHQWLDGDPGNPPPPHDRRAGRNHHWQHLNSMRILSMPDTWEYPWFAAWDLAFQAIPLALIDPEFAKEQLWLMLFEQFQHPNGQIPAYEWEFSDLNPPVHAWAVWRVYNMDRLRAGKADRAFLEKCFHKLLINFAWWVNKVDARGNCIFEGGFLGFDNITLLDRSGKLQDGARLNQSDATGWMGMFCLNLMRIALELAKENSAYESLATKFFQHYIYIGAAMKNMGNRGWQLWDEEDGFFYDVLEYPDGRFEKFRVRSLVGLVPLFAVERLEEDWIEPFPEFRKQLHWFLANRKELVDHCVTTMHINGKTVHLLSIINPSQMKRLLERVWDEDEFRSEFGLRSLSRYHLNEPFRSGGQEVRYEPAESISKIKGGNSNWRGPIWFPTTFMMIESLRKLKKAFGNQFVIHDSWGREVTLKEMTSGFANRLIRLFMPDENGRRPIHGDCSLYADDPHFRDLVLFYEYFHGDTGAGLGASHQTGWTALIASIIDEWRQK